VNVNKTSIASVMRLGLAYAAASVFVYAAGLPVIQGEVTFSKDIAPIMQQHCQNCHQPDAAAPMSLITYKDVRPWAKEIKRRTLLRDRQGVMPPWFVEKDYGINHFKNDPSLSDVELARIAKWVDDGAPEGNPADMPPAKDLGGNSHWTAGEPDLILKTAWINVKASAPDYFGELPGIPTGLLEDRYVASVEMREENDYDGTSGRQTVGSRYVIHHMIWTVNVPGMPASAEDFNPDTASGSWPIHEVGRNADFFPEDAGKLLRAGSVLNPYSIHTHSNGRDTRARLLYGFRFYPKGYKPTTRYAPRSLGDGDDVELAANTADQRFDAYQVLEEPTRIKSWEPHMHAAGKRMCLEAIWGHTIETLSCVGYDHNWVIVYDFDDDYAPLLPKGTILHLIGYFDTTGANKNVTDPRNWKGSGNISISNMFHDNGESIALTDEQFFAEMERRKQKLGWTDKNDVILGCPLCNTKPMPVDNKPRAPRTPTSTGTGAGGQ
jgi:hypothetical protein